MIVSVEFSMPSMTRGFPRNTLVIATSDHGAAAYAGNIRKATPFQYRELEQLGHYSGGGYRGFKFSIYEGGLRIPFVAKWPGVIPAGKECDELIGLVDLMATFSEITGSEIPAESAPDSISFLPLLEDPDIKGHRDELVLQSTHAFAVRQGKWKLAVCPGSGSAGRYGNLPKTEDAWKDAVTAFGRTPQKSDLFQAPFVQLFNLENDPGETQNLAAEKPEKVEKLLGVLNKTIKRGRATPGPALENDRPVDPLVRVPGFVFRK